MNAVHKTYLCYHRTYLWLVLGNVDIFPIVDLIVYCVATYILGNKSKLLLS